MKERDLLTTCSLLAMLLLTIHMADDIVRGYSPGGLGNLTVIVILVTWLCATFLFAERRAGTIITLLGSLAAAAMPVIHMRGRGVGTVGSKSEGATFFIWTLLALGVIGWFGIILSIRALRRPRT